MSDDRTGYYVTYEFEYKGNKDDYFDYDVPFDILMEGVRTYFSNQMVDIDGTDNAIWNSLVGINDDVIESIFDSMNDWFKERCASSAYEEFKEEIDSFED